MNFDFGQKTLNCEKTKVEFSKYELNKCRITYLFEKIFTWFEARKLSHIFHKKISYLKLPFNLYVDLSETI